MKAQTAIAGHLRMYLKRQPLVSFLEDRLVSLLEDPTSPMFQDLINLIRRVVNSEEFLTKLLERLIIQWREESQHSSMSSITLTKVLGIVDTQRIAKDIKLGIVNWLDQWEHAEGEQREWLCRKLEILLYSMNGQLSFGVQNWQNEFVDALPIEEGERNLSCPRVCRSQNHGVMHACGHDGHMAMQLMAAKCLQRWKDQWTEPSS